MLPSASPAESRPLSVLVTGFDPFGGSAVNPSWDAIHALDGRIVAGHRIVGGEIPTVFGASLQRLEALMEQYQPRLVICTGQDSDRSLYDALLAQGAKAHLIGGAAEAAELDAMRAIDQGVRLAHAL